MENIAFKIAKSIASTLEESVLKKGYATFVVSGGNSPLEIFSHLNQMPIPWSKITIILGDDRMLDSGNSESKRAVLDQAIGDSHLPVHHLINQNKVKIEFSDVDF